MPSPGQEKKSTRAVLDTNILISAYLFRKRLGGIADLVQSNRVLPCFIVSSFEELEAAFTYPKFSKTLDQHRITPQDILAKIVAKSVILPDPKQIPHIVSQLGDNYILAAAVATGAEYIVTGDAELGRLHFFLDIPIVTAREFLELVTK